MIIPLAVFAIFSLASASDVLEFTDSDFADKVAEHDVILVEFFTPWCGHCKALAPEYEKAATALRSNDPPVPLAKVDCSLFDTFCKRLGLKQYPTLAIYRKGEWVEEYEEEKTAANTAVCGKYGVSGYPTLKIFKGGEMAEDYNGPREADGIEKIMRLKAGPVSKELLTVADAEKFKTSSESMVL